MRPRNPYQVRDRDALQERVNGSQRVVKHTLRTLAELAGCSHSTIGALLTGEKTRVSPELAQRLSAVLGVPMEDLFMPTTSASGNGNNSEESAA